MARTPVIRAVDLCDEVRVNPERVARAASAMTPAATVNRIAETVRVLGDPTRLTIALALASEELCVCDLAALIGRSQPTVSHSLRALRQLRLVRFRREGKIAYYSLADDHVLHLLDQLVSHVEEEQRPAGEAVPQPASRRGSASATGRRGSVRAATRSGRR